MLRIDSNAVSDLLGPYATWSVRNNRGLLTDRTQLGEPIPFVPFATITAADVKNVLATAWEAAG